MAPQKRSVPKGDKDLASITILMKELNYIRGKTYKPILATFEDSLEHFRKAYVDREGSDWSRFNDWDSPDHKAALNQVAKEYLEWDGNGRRFWPADETDPFHNRIVFPRDEVRIKPRLVEVLYRKVHPKPEEHPKKTKQIRKRTAGVSGILKPNSLDGNKSSPSTSLLSPHTPSTGGQSAAGPSSTITACPEKDPRKGPGKVPEKVSEKVPTGPNSDHDMTRNREESLFVPDTVELSSPLIHDEGRFSWRPSTPPSPTMTLPRQTPLPLRSSISVRPHAPDAVMQDAAAPTLEPSIEAPYLGETCSGIMPSPVVRFNYEVIHSRKPLEGENWNIQGQLSTKSLADLKAELPLDFETGKGTGNVLAFTLAGPGPIASVEGWFRWKHVIDHTDEEGFGNVKRTFRKKVEQCLAKQRGRPGPFCFDIEIELVGGARRSMSVARSGPDIEFSL